MGAPIRPELLARFGNDPDALEWARGVVQQSLEPLEEALAMPGATPEMKQFGGFTANWLREQFIGVPPGPEVGDLGIYGRFDSRFGVPRAEPVERDHHCIPCPICEAQADV